jgi:hypothetical protein
VQACFVYAQASGATSIARLIDWAVNGDPDATDKAKQAKEEARAAEREASKIAAQEAIDAAPVASLGLDDEPQVAVKQEAAPTPVQEAAPSLPDVSAMSDDDLAQLAKLVSAEMASRKGKAKKAA